ncbi:MAG: DUF2497 domain-containing protein [Proteobacteria bacterium]|nr:DUF2497 domain-containing protein [Pseudomonadota bacterium]
MHNQEVQNAIDDIKNLMNSNIDIKKMRANALELKEIVQSTKKQEGKASDNRSASNLDSAIVDNAYAKIAEGLQVIMRLYLKEWLNDNLPSIVKRSIEEQIKNLIQSSNE